jgi:hypothetical protein
MIMAQPSAQSWQKSIETALQMEVSVERLAVLLPALRDAMLENRAFEQWLATLSSSEILSLSTLVYYDSEAIVYLFKRQIFEKNRIDSNATSSAMAGLLNLSLGLANEAFKRAQVMSQDSDDQEGFHPIKTAMILNFQIMNLSAEQPTTALAIQADHGSTIFAYIQNLVSIFTKNISDTVTTAGSEAVVHAYDYPYIDITQERKYIRALRAVKSVSINSNLLHRNKEDLGYKALIQLWTAPEITSQVRTQINKVLRKYIVSASNTHKALQASLIANTTDSAREEGEQYAKHHGFIGESRDEIINSMISRRLMFVQDSLNYHEPVVEILVNLLKEYARTEKNSRFEQHIFSIIQDVESWAMGESAEGRHDLLSLLRISIRSADPAVSVARDERKELKSMLARVDKAYAAVDVCSSLLRH